MTLGKGRVRDPRRFFRDKTNGFRMQRHDRSPLSITEAPVYSDRPSVYDRTIDVLQDRRLTWYAAFPNSILRSRRWRRDT